MAAQRVQSICGGSEEGRSLVEPNVRAGATNAEERMQLVEEHVQAEVVHDLDAIMRTWGKSPWFDDVAWEEQSYGRDHIRGHYDELLKSFPDLAIDVKERRQTEDAVILEVIVSGTHTGQWRALPPLGRKMSSRVCAIYTFDSDGLLELERTYYDKAIILEQLGIFKDPRTNLGKLMAVITPPFGIVRALIKKLLHH
jgi:steroid delta-isomerase-like uncharacterized protein